MDDFKDDSAVSVTRIYVGSTNDEIEWSSRFPSSFTTSSRAGNDISLAKLIATVRESAFGSDQFAPTPFGPRRMLYCDHTASGQALSMIEEPIYKEVIPVYANTHTTTSYSGFLSHSFFSESRDIIRDSVGADQRDDVVLFCGNGSTGASDRLAYYLCGTRVESSCTSSNDEIARRFSCIFPGCGRSFPDVDMLTVHARTHPDGESSAWRATSAINNSLPLRSEASTSKLNNSAQDSRNPLVLVGPFAHHSSFLPWIQAGANVKLLSESVYPPYSSKYDDMEGVMHPDESENGFPALELVGTSLKELIENLCNFYENHTSLFESGVLDKSLVLPVCIFTMASNVTGQLSPVSVLTAAAHALGARAVWDAAAAAPHIRLNVNPQAPIEWDEIRSIASFQNVPESLLERADRLVRALYVTNSQDHSELFHFVRAGSSRLMSEPAKDSNPRAENLKEPPKVKLSCRMDAVFFSPHKFAGGGAGTVGVLVLKRRLLPTRPSVWGGGTVFFVDSEGSPLFLGNDTEREEAGTPSSVAVVRSALVLRLFRSLSAAARSRERALIRIALARLLRVPNLHIVGHRSPVERLPVISFVIGASDSQSPLLYHWALVSAILNDFFGIQARGGCLCAGPYAHALLGLDQAQSKGIKETLLQKDELVRPGFVRLSISYTTAIEEFIFLLNVLEFVAKNISLLSNLYQAIPDSGEFRIRRAVAKEHLDKALHRISTGKGPNLKGNEWLQLNVDSILDLNLISGEDMTSMGENDSNTESIRTIFKGMNWQQYLQYRATLNGDSLNVTGDAYSHLLDAEKGLTRAPPRRWLSSINFSGDESNGVSFPDHSITLKNSSGSKEEKSPKESLRRLFSSILDAQLVAFSISGFKINDNGLVDYEHLSLDVSKTSGDSEFNVGIRKESMDYKWWITSPNDLTITPVLNTDLSKEWIDQSGKKRTILLPIGKTISKLDSSLRNKFIISSKSFEKGCLLKSSVASMISLPYEVTSHVISFPEKLGHSLVYNSDIISRSARPSSSTVLSGSNNDSMSDVCPIAIAKEKAKERRELDKLSTPDEEPSTKRKKIASYQLVSIAEVKNAETSASVESIDMDKSNVVIDQEKKTKRRRVPPSPAFIESLKPQKAALERMKINALVPSSLQRQIFHKMNDCISEYDMIREGDRLMVGLSGGKDSMSLLVALLRLRTHAPVNFDIAAVTVDPMYPGYDPSPLKEWCQTLGVPYFFERYPIMKLAEDVMTGDSICAFCSRMKRGILYSACRREGYNVLVLGQHSDDIVESFVMSAFQNGILRTMKAHYLNDAGDIRIIRPLAHVRERHTRELASILRLPLIDENCPACFTNPVVRARTKQLIAREEASNPNLVSCVVRAVKPLLKSRGMDALREVAMDTSMEVVEPTSTPIEWVLAGGKEFAGEYNRKNHSERSTEGKSDAELIEMVRRERIKKESTIVADDD